MNISKNKKAGICKLCGKETFLTFEHVPPKAAFNNLPVRKIESDDLINMISDPLRKPWDFEGVHGKDMQKGSGDYYLCQSCNNNTGDWYIKEYVKFSREIEKIEYEIDDPKRNQFTINDIYPLRIFKAIMTMFCDINNNCFGDEKLREFLLNKESTEFDNNKYQLYLYFPKGSIMRMCPYSVLGFTDGFNLSVSEISRYPIGLALYFDKPDDYCPEGILINDMLNYGYYDKTNYNFENVPFLNINSSFPADYRTKEEIEDCMNECNEEMIKEI